MAVPKYQAHLSPFSYPAASNHAFPFGSVMVSFCSWLTTLIVGSASLLFGCAVASQSAGTVSVYGWFAYSVSLEPLPIPLWYAQYWLNAQCVESLQLPTFLAVNMKNSLAGPLPHPWAAATRCTSAWI